MTNLFCGGQKSFSKQGLENWGTIHWHKHRGVITMEDIIKKADVPNPGSEEAIKQGCTCPVLDNNYGEGFPYDGETCFYISGDCPLHDGGR